MSPLCGSAAHRRLPFKHLAEITQDNCVFVEFQQAVCDDWDGGGVASLVCSLDVRLQRRGHNAFQCQWGSVMLSPWQLKALMFDVLKCRFQDGGSITSCH